MKHLASVTYPEDPVCMPLDDKMHMLEVADGSKGEEVTCPRCLEIIQWTQEEENT